ncbi:MAG: hypothetical protein PHG05_01370 [Candidatus Nanoarchaeia archaeon]|nr:hypothetical protein [Candidatus Nanoarchaeia archaeon]
MKDSLKRLGFFGVVFLVLLVLIFLIFFLIEQVKDRLLVSIIIAFVLAVIVTILKSPFRKELSEEENQSLRFTMICKQCGWEWMSNITSSGSKPTKCPNCRSDNLETIGWRKVKLQKKKERDLRSFFK